MEELYGTRYQSGSFSLINVGSVFHCPLWFSFFFFFFFFVFMASVGVIEKALSLLYVQSSCWMWVVRKGVCLWVMLKKHCIGLHRGARIFFFFGVCAVHVVLCKPWILEGWVIVDVVYWVYVTYLLWEGHGTIVLCDEGGSCLCKRLCCGVKYRLVIQFIAATIWHARWHHATHLSSCDMQCQII